ncbi:phage tail length tape measure family protein [Luteibacter anthropi]|uniref:phage tail length tape measure family protein n=1 Tax=Luteibacter anthropi TaxID=564369 RepID=UPI002032E183|nr:phage tail length tape measure family protein [Luteibacter anthropi]URX63251.1 phage tail length tape measure family protein [Luteibacter anthropi]
MGNDRTIAIALQIKTDLNKARGDVDGIKEAIDDLGATAEKAGPSLDDLESSVEDLGERGRTTGAAVDDLGRAVDGLGTSGRGTGAAVEGLGRTVSGLGNTGRATNATLREQTAELAKLLGEIDPTVAALDRLDEQEAKLQKYRSAGLLDDEGLAHYQNQVNQSRAALGNLGVTAGQTRQAMRQLPAQITDIVTGLATGQPVMQVALQQGGQLRDSFGSFGGVLKGLASLISPTVVGVGALAAVVGILVVGTVEGFQQQQRFNEALNQTGGYAGKTGAQLSVLASSIGQATGAFGDSAQAVALLAESGRISGDTLDVAARGAVAFSEVTGKSIDDAVAKFVSLSKDPVSAIKALDDQYHFLETSVYAQIRALQEQGQETAAEALAQRTLADAFEARRARDVANLGIIQNAWRALKAEVSGVWDEIKQGGALIANLGSQVTQQQLNQLYALRGYYESIGFGLGEKYIAGVDQRIAALKEQQAAEEATAKAEAAHQRQQSEGNAALDRIAATHAKYATAADQYKKELDDINANFDAAIKAMPGKADELNAQRATQLRAAVSAYAASLQKSAGRPDRSAEREAAAEAKAAAAAQEQLLQSLTQLQGELDPTAAAWVRYNDTVNKANAQAEQAKKAPGANIASINAQRDAVVALAGTIRDAAIDKIIDKDRQAWETLREALRTPSEVKVETAIDQIKQLNAFLANGTINAQQYHDALQRVGQNSVVAAPKYQGVDAVVGGPAGELGKSFKAAQDLETWHTQQLAANEAFRQQDTANEEVYQARKAEIAQQYAEQTAAITQAQQQLALAAASDGFANLADIAKSAYGEQSAQYRALFALSKAFAIAQAAISLGVNVAKASESGFPANIGFIAGAIAQGVQIASIIAGATFSGGGSSSGSSSSGKGYAEGGYTGPGGKFQPAGIVHAGEGVLNQQEVGALGGPGGFFALRHAIAAGTLQMPGYADGGYVNPIGDAPRVAAPSSSVARLPDGTEASAAPAVHNNFSFLTSFDANDLAEKILSTPVGERLVVSHVVANGSQVKSGIGA